jgi:large subunit ribosomal protein L18
MIAKKVARRTRIRYGIRSKVSGTAVRPRVSIFRSNKEIYAQIIDDVAGHTLCAASSREQEIKTQGGTKAEQAKHVGTSLAQRALAKGVDSVIFDRGGYLYHGRIKSLADGAREGGLKF